MNKKQNFIKGAAILTVANFTSSVMGGIFKIPLVNLMGQYGMGLFMFSHTLFAFILDVSVSGFPVAVSKMIAESRARHDYLRAHKILRISLLLLGAIGSIGMVASLAFAGLLAYNFGDPNAYIGILCASPAILFVSVTSVFRGYFQGHQNMYPTAISEVIESVLKLVIGYVLAFILLKFGIQYASAGAVLGISIGTAISLTFLAIVYLFNASKDKLLYAGEPTAGESYKDILKELFRIALPITLGAILTNITTLVDFGTIISGLQKFPGITRQIATSMYGSYAGCIVAIYNFPLIIVLAVRMSIVPAIAASLADKNHHKAQQLIGKAQKVLNIFAIPFSIILIALADPILSFLFVDKNNPLLLQTLALSILPSALLFLSSSVLQAYGEVNKPVIYMLAGGIVKITLNFLLIPRIGIISAPISTGAYMLTSLSLCFIELSRVTKFKFQLSNYLKPLISAGTMGISAYFICNYTTIFLSNVTHINFRIILFISLSIACLIAGMIYLIMLLVTKTIARDDLEMLPYGNSIACILEKWKLLSE